MQNVSCSRAWSSALPNVSDARSRKGHRLPVQEEAVPGEPDERKNKQRYESNETEAGNPKADGVVALLAVLLLEPGVSVRKGSER